MYGKFRERIRKAAAAEALLLLLGLGACAKGPARFSGIITEYFDTATTVVAYDESQELFEEHLSQFEARMGELDRLYSIYDSCEGINNLKTVNDLAGAGPVEVDDRIIGLLEFGKEAYEITGGKVNICMGSVLSLWHEKREEDKNELPDEDALYEASRHTDISGLVIDERNGTVFLEDEHMRLDVGAIAKGYAARELRDFAKDNLWHDAAISMGGNVITFGNKYADGRTLWNVIIENPDPAGEGELAALKLTDLCVVTSGDYQRFYMVDGKSYCHIISPDTLYPPENFSSVTVICEDPALADALSTYLFIVDKGEGEDFVASHEGIEAIWTDRDYIPEFSEGAAAYAGNQI